MRFNVYIAAHFQDIERVNSLASTLASHGAQVISSWHEKVLKRTSELSEVARAELAGRELREIRGADVLILLASSLPTPGGRHVEFGYALAFCRTCIVVGAPENLFHWLDGVKVVDMPEDAVALLMGEAA